MVPRRTIMRKETRRNVGWIASCAGRPFASRATRRTWVGCSRRIAVDARNTRRGRARGTRATGRGTRGEGQAHASRGKHPACRTRRRFAWRIVRRATAPWATRAVDCENYPVKKRRVLSLRPTQFAIGMCEVENIGGIRYWSGSPGYHGVALPLLQRSHPLSWMRVTYGRAHCDVRAVPAGRSGR